MSIRGRWWSGLAVVLLGLANAQGSETPKWEIGAGIGVTSFPHYRGSDQNKIYALPIPYIKYTGDKLRVDRSGIRGDLFRRDDLTLDVSAAIGPPSSSEDDHAREGMPDLDPTLELGPSLKWRWYKSPDINYTVALQLPLRGVVATDLRHTQSIGWLFAPAVVFDWRDVGEDHSWSTSASVGPLYAAEAYHDYYYDVASKYATPERPAYDAPGGYSGSRITFTLSRRFDHLWVGAFLRYDNLSGAVFEDSPLVRTKSALMGGLGISWIFFRSKETVSSSTEAKL